MRRTIVCCIALIALSGIAVAEEPTDDKQLSGMSIVGNDEAPKSLVIVPWKSSDRGDVLDVSRILDDGRQPVDRDVFRRELAYYEIWARSQGTRSMDSN